MGSPSTKTIPSLVQGVSQQSAEQRRDSQCEEQFDCFNSVKDGVVARNGADLEAFLVGLDLTTAYTFELFRGIEEHYLVCIIRPSAGVAASIRVFDYETGIECTVTPIGTGLLYLNNDPVLYPPRDSFTVQTVDDYSFVANNVVQVGMKGTLSSIRQKEAIVFFKAGGYSLVYKITLVIAGTSYNWTYKTPDNSAPINAEYITTNNLASTFYLAMTGVSPPTSSLLGTAGVGTGDGGGSGSGVTSVVTKPGGSPTLASLGFGIEINGNLLRIYREDGVDFLIDTSDGAGDSHIAALKDNVKSFSELPQSGFPGVLLQVRGVANSARTDYFVEYVGGVAASGYWRERIGPGVPIDLDDTAMPNALINTGPNTFTFGPVPWSSRLCGDGVNTAKNPGFIGKRITEVFYHKGRLGILTEATADWSKALSPFTHFPDTVQSVLDDAPVGITLAAGNTTALLKKTLAVDEGLFLWAQKAQFRVNSGSDPFKQSTVDAPEAGAYEFAEKCNFGKVGSSVYLATEPDDYVTIRSLQFANGKLAGDIDVTAHVSDYIPAGARRLSVSDTGQILYVQTDGAPSHLFLYNYVVQDRQVVQSAWNTWRFPEGTIVRSSVYRDKLYVLLQRETGVAILKLPLSHRKVDPGGAYQTRLDMRVTESQCVVTYNAVDNQTVIQPPYPVSVPEGDTFRVVLRSTFGSARRGKMYPVIGVIAPGQVVVEGDLTGAEFYAGFRIDSRREESTFHLRGPEGVVTVDELTIREFRVNHSKSGYYRIEVFQGADRTKVEELHPRIPGISTPAVGVDPPLDTGSLTAGVDMQNIETRIVLVNDTPFPSRWQTSAYTYEATLRSKISKVKAGGA